jgi:uncharacterized protein (DUF488 family)
MKIGLVERGTIYTLGYAAPHAAAQLERYMRMQSILLVDVRLRPISRWACQWDKAALASRYGSYYRWEPRLGNLHYWDRERDIRLPAEHPNAITELATLVLAGTSLVLLCACRDTRACHRTIIAKLLQDALPAPASFWEVRI